MDAWSVLIVDDSAPIRKVIRELFSRETDFHVCGEADNGQKAVEMAQRLHPSLIITDLSMPVMNGLEETRILRQLLPDTAIIMYSVHVDPFVEREAMAAGASAALRKSDVVALLISRARDLLSERAA